MKPHSTGIWFHTYLPIVLTSWAVLVNFQAVPQSPKTWNKLIGPRQISWETHSGITKFSVLIHTPHSAVSLTSAMHWTHLWYFCGGAGWRNIVARTEEWTDMDTHHPPTHPPDLSSPASISETFQSIEQELTLSLRNSTKISVCRVTLRHWE